MNKYLVSLIFLGFSFNSFAQNAEYKLSAGANYNFFTMSSSSYQAQNQQSIPTNSGYTTYSLSTYDLKVKSSGGSGFFIKNDFSFPVNKKLSFNTGFGISLNNSDLTTISKSTYSSNGYIFLDSFNVLVLDTNSIYSYDYDYISKSYYNILLLNIPIQLKLKLLKEKLDLTGGLTISALIQAKKTIPTTESKYTIIATNNFENMFFSVNFGVAYNIFDNIYVRFQYDYSLTDVFKTTSDIQSYSYTQNYYKTHLNTLSLILSYKF